VKRGDDGIESCRKQCFAKGVPLQGEDQVYTLTACSGSGGNPNMGRCGASDAKSRDCELPDAQVTVHRCCDRFVPFLPIIFIYAILTLPPFSAEAVSSSDLVVEAIVENLEIKRDLFGFLDRNANSHCMFASNTTSFSIGDIAVACSADRLTKFGGFHFFNRE
jgi:hypothetical protein